MIRFCGILLLAPFLLLSCASRPEVTMPEAPDGTDIPEERQAEATPPAPPVVPAEVPEIGKSGPVDSGSDGNAPAGGTADADRVAAAAGPKTPVGTAGPVLTSGVVEEYLEEMFPDLTLPLPELVPEPDGEGSDADTADGTSSIDTEGAAAESDARDVGRTDRAGVPPPADQAAPPRPPAGLPGEPAPGPVMPAEPKPPKPAIPPAEPVPDRPPTRVSAARASHPSASDTAMVRPSAETAERRIVGSPGEEIDVTFPGAGWLFLGIEGGERGIEFLRRSADPAATSFRFRADEPGEYRIVFQRQDMVAGDIREEHTLISVRSPGETAGMEASGAAAAPAERERVPQNAVPPGTGGIGPAASGTNRPVGELGGYEPENAGENLMLAGARYREDEGDLSGAIELYRQYLERAAGEGDAGAIWYRLGRLYEAESPSRDLKKALQAYRTVESRYPISPFFRPARERIQYLNRHIFDLR